MSGKQETWYLPIEEPPEVRKHSRVPRDDLDVEFVRSILDYEPDTGALRWKVRSELAAKRKTSWNDKYAGSIAGTIDHKGYRRVKINNRAYKAHRLIWAIVEGQWPAHQIDHKNGRRDDNRWANLRQATHGENAQNSGARRQNVTGLKGVSLRKKKTPRWSATIEASGKRLHLGAFPSAEEAYAAYCAAAFRLHGEFANVGAAAISRLAEKKDPA